MKKIVLILITVLSFVFSKGQNGVIVPRGTPNYIPSGNSTTTSGYLGTIQAGLGFIDGLWTDTATANAASQNIKKNPFYNIATLTPYAKWYRDTVHSVWVQFGTGGSGGGSRGWDTTGNFNIDASVNFIGTINDADFIVKRHNLRGGLLNESLNNTSWGVEALNNAGGGGFRNTAVGYHSLLNNGLGNTNSAFGYNSLQANTNGIANTGIGYDALLIAAGDSFNTALGGEAGNSVFTGNNNLFLGNYATAQGTVNNSIAVGFRATAIGSNSFYISDSIKHLYFKNLDSSISTAPNVVSIDAAGNWHRYKNSGASGGLTLTNGQGILGSPYNGTANQTWQIDSTKYASLFALNDTAGILRALSNGKQSQLNGTGYVKQSGLTSSYVTAIPNSDLANSTISGVALGGNLNTLTLGSGLLGGSYNGSTTVTAKADTSLLATQYYVNSHTGTTQNTIYNHNDTLTGARIVSGGKIAKPLTFDSLSTISLFSTVATQIGDTAHNVWFEVYSNHIAERTSSNSLVFNTEYVDSVGTRTLFNDNGSTQDTTAIFKAANTEIKSLATGGAIQFVTTNGVGILGKQTVPAFPSPNTANKYLNGYGNYVTLNSDSITEGSTNLFFTNSRARLALSVNAPLLYNNSTGVFSADTSTNAVHLATQGFVTRQGYLTTNQPITVTATGDATGTSTSSGTAPSLPLTLATVNVNVGTFTNATVTTNAKGLITAISNGSAGGTGTVTSIATSTGILGGTITTTGTLKLDTTFALPRADSIPSGYYPYISNPLGFKTSAMDTLYRTLGKDSLQFTINGRYHAVLDSAGSGGGSGVTTVGTFNTFLNAANGLTISGTSLYAQKVSPTAVGMITTGADTLAGVKNFNSDPIIHTLTVGLGHNSVATNTAIGFQALSINTSGANCTAGGYQSFTSNTTGGNNTGFGTYTGFSNTVGQHNAFFGYGAGLTNNGTTPNGSDNSFMGYQCGYNASTGYQNTFMGSLCGFAHLNGNNNTAVGAGCFKNNTVGIGNTAVGGAAMALSVTGSNNTIGGFGGLSGCTFCSFNTAWGYGALDLDTVGNNNTAIGNLALQDMLRGQNNTVVGGSALPSNSNDSNCTAIGYANFLGNTSSCLACIFVGINNLTSTTTQQADSIAIIGNSNTISGGFSGALRNTTIVGSNVVISRNNLADFGTATQSIQLGNGGGNTTAMNALTAAASDIFYNTDSSAYCVYTTKWNKIDYSTNNYSIKYSHTIFTPTTGSTVALLNNQYNIINPSGALLALTVNLPSSPNNNDVVYIKFTQNVTTVTYGNGTVVDGITAPTAGGLTVLTYDSGTTSWY